MALLTARLGLGDWSWEPTVLCGLAALLIGYVLLQRRRVLRPDDDVGPWFRNVKTRPVVYATGVGVAFIALQSPIDRGGDEFLFAIHMLQHLLLMMVAPPLLLLGIAGMRSETSRHPWLWRTWRAITRPWPALIIFNIVMLIWHIPALYDTTLTTQAVHIIEHLSFMAAGVIFWWPIVDPMRGVTATSVTSLTKIAALVISGIPPTVLGLIFALSPAAYYDFYVHAPRLWGLTPVQDQQVGGIFMLGLGNIIYFVAIAIIFMRLLGDSARDEEEAAARLALRQGG
jgi:putative membrane protein